MKQQLSPRILMEGPDLCHVISLKARVFHLKEPTPDMDAFMSSSTILCRKGALNQISIHIMLNNERRRVKLTPKLSSIPWRKDLSIIEYLTSHCMPANFPAVLPSFI